jgi:hypothetical protein
MRYVNRFLALFRSEATTIGVSPKALAPIIGAAITAGLAWVGVTPHEIGQVIGVSDAVVAAGEVTIAAKIAAILLGPGTVVRPEPSLTEGNDARLSDEVAQHLAAAPGPVATDGP